MAMRWSRRSSRSRVTAISDSNRVSLTRLKGTQRAGGACAKLAREFSIRRMCISELSALLWLRAADQHTLPIESDLRIVGVVRFAGIERIIIRLVERGPIILGGT